MTKKIYSTLIFIAAAMSICPAQTPDYPGTADYPLIKRVTGSHIYYGRKTDYDRLKLALEKVEWNAPEMRNNPYKSVTVEGRRLTNWYAMPQGMSVLEVWRNYEQELREQGFEILFSAEGADAETPGYNNMIARDVLGITGTYGTPETSSDWPLQTNDDKKAAYIAAKKSTDTGDVFASVYIIYNATRTKSGGIEAPADVVLARLDVCEVKQREQRMTLVTSAEMNNEISLNGKVALYGILFDFNSSDIKPESAETLDEISKLLKENPKLNILVVGHTDAVGSFEYNKNLSQKRAESVVKSLVDKGISRERLFPVGVSFAAPVATNATEDGRAKNRRVELVDMAGGKAN